MISQLRKLGIEPQAIEQPLDISIPENKMMLAFYLAAPEVENDRRVLNVISGMQRAKKEGRWMGAAPIGYENKTDPDGRKYIAPKEPQASLLKWAFKELSEGILAADQVRQLVNDKGLSCSRSQFWITIRNPIYCGKIIIPKYKDEERQLVTGKHEPIITETLFYDVQDVLDGKKRRERPNTKVFSNENLPLRGFLSCPNCERMLTGSASKGQYYTYYYYHCLATCGCRFRAEEVNGHFIELISRFKVHPSVAALYKLNINTVYKRQIGSQQNGSKQISQEINQYNDKVTNRANASKNRYLNCDVAEKVLGKENLVTLE